MKDVGIGYTLRYCSRDASSNFTILRIIIIVQVLIVKPRKSNCGVGDFGVLIQTNSDLLYPNINQILRVRLIAMLTIC